VAGARRPPATMRLRADGERAGVRGGTECRYLLWLPLTLALSRLAWGEGTHLVRLQSRRAASGLLCRLDETDDAFRQGRRPAGLGGQRQDSTLQVVDLGRAPAQQVLPHRGAGAGVDRQHAPR